VQAAKKHLDTFHKVVAAYPHKNDIDSERELIACAEKVDKEKRNIQE
jgi:hypothetical protein